MHSERKSDPMLRPIPRSPAPPVLVESIIGPTRV